MEMSDSLYREAEPRFVADMAATMEINTLEPEALAEFQERVQPVYQQMIEAGHFTADDVVAARAAASGCSLNVPLDAGARPGRASRTRPLPSERVKS